MLSFHASQTVAPCVTAHVGPCGAAAFLRRRARGAAAGQTAFRQTAFRFVPLRERAAPREQQSVAGAPEGCRFAAAGPNNVRLALTRALRARRARPQSDCAQRA